MEKVSKERIDALIAELRSWGNLEQRYTIRQLAEKFDLTTFIVSRIATAEGYTLKTGELPGYNDDPDATTKAVPPQIDSQVDTRPEGIPLDDELDTTPYQRN